MQCVELLLTLLSPITNEVEQLQATHPRSFCGECRNLLGREAGLDCLTQQLVKDRASRSHSGRARSL